MVLVTRGKYASLETWFSSRLLTKRHSTLCCQSALQIFEAMLTSFPHVNVSLYPVIIYKESKQS